MSNIIVGVDGSPQAQAALQWAVEEGRLRGADVTAIYAYLPNPSDFYGFPGAVTPQQLEAVSKEADHQAEQILQEVMADAKAQTEGVRIHAEAVRGESPVSALVERSGTADLLVVGSRGRGGFKGMLLGSVSQQVAQHSKCPVVIIGGKQ